MIPITTFKGKTVAVFGLGGSGLACLRALASGGAYCLAWDDSEARCKEAAEIAGVTILDLHEADWRTIDALVLSPGVPLTHPEPHWTVKLAQAANVEIIGDIELFVRERNAIAPGTPFVAITGTNGKSTTTALISHILGEAGYDVQMGGNIGTPILALEPFDKTGDGSRIYVIEISSYQIDLSPGLNPSIGLLLNVSADHLDRHGSLQNYAQIKARLVAKSDVAIIGLDDRYSANIASNLRLKERKVVPISGFSNDRATVRAPDGFLQSKMDGFLFNLDQARALRGTHNAQNASAAVAIAQQFDLSATSIAKGLMSFAGLEHRMEEVGHEDGILYINDSKGTNADAAGRALGAFSKVHWIAGGLAKEGGIDILVDHFDRVECAYLIGEAADDFAKSLAAKNVPYKLCAHLDVALQEAILAAKENKDANAGKGEEVILLSPACASFDQFPNFMKRGDVFRALVANYLETGKVPVEAAHAAAFLAEKEAN
ncbi:MAG: UDP-N-acetylmuramoyl-L-alanine--D-glutamate ligase [Cohaesibacter sp.]|jgi:UDP-N-acetylmuramoylalanine--D-glutamate ligase|nr:UDP-N-acetylmuramoyl-L-alanine--D-glutamate ligase [Cohaesibacter sp.]